VIPVEESDKEHRELTCQRREGGRADPIHWPFVRTDNFAYINSALYNANDVIAPDNEYYMKCE